MTMPHRIAALALTVCLLALPTSGSAEAVIGTRLLSASSYQAQRHPIRAQFGQRVAFNWLANGAAAPSLEKAKASQKRSRVITGRGSWICSPAGFGKRSQCYAG